MHGEAEKPAYTVEKFYGQSADEFCSNLNNEEDPLYFPKATSCILLKDNIITFFASPSYEIYCRDFGNQHLIRKIVAVDLLGNNSMDVLTFYYSFLSLDLQQELTDIIDQTGGCHDLEEPDEDYYEAEKEFNDKVDEILERIESGDIDDETKQNLENFDYFANSIEEWRAFENWPDWAQSETT